MASINRVKKIIKAGRESGVCVWIWGDHGNGKSELVRQVTEELGIQFIDIRVALTEAGDWMGIPYANPVTKEMDFLPSPFLPKDPNSKGILFLDELNRGRPDVLQSVFQIALDKRIGTHYELPKGWSIVAAGNPGDADYQVTDIDPALLGRFCHVHLTPTRDEWLQFASDYNVRDDVRSFIKDNPKMLGQAIKSTKMESLKGNPRGYVLLGKMVDALEGLDKADPKGNYTNDCISDIAFGLVGSAAATEYTNYRKTQFRRIDVTKILNDYPSIREDVLKSVKSGRGDLQKEAIEDLFKDKKLKIEEVIEDKKKFNNLLKFLTDIPADMGFVAAEIIMNNYRELMNAILDHKSKEALKFYDMITGLDKVETREDENGGK